MGSIHEHRVVDPRLISFIRRWLKGTHPSKAAKNDSAAMDRLEIVDTGRRRRFSKEMNGAGSHARGNWMLRRL